MGGSETVDDSRGWEAERAPPIPGVVVVATAGQPVCRPLRLGAGLELGRDTAGLSSDDRLSRKHLRVERRQGFVVHDLGSRNGTWVDGARVTSPVAAESGAVVRGGRTLMLLVDDVQPFEASGVHASATGVAGPRLSTVFDAIARAALQAGTLLLRGESGTGKERAARAYHALGPAALGPFVPVNCATLPEGVAERLLFGARKGAFSGATDSDGLVRSAHGGVLFLDEIGELGLEVQAKLLRLLESREVLPLGATRPVRVDVRFAFATHRDLRADTAAGRFRADLFYRIEQPCIELPPLRERREEIPFLCATASSLPLHAAFVEACLLRSWPGNVRELLRNVAQACEVALEAKATEVLVEHLPPEAGRAFGPRSESSLLGPRSEGSSEREPDLEAVREALRVHGGNVSAAARSLGVHRTQLRRWIERYAL